MSTSSVLNLDAYRGRRDQRARTALALHAADTHRLALLRYVWRALRHTESDRGAVVWVDEYGPGVVHPHVVLDLASDRPRRDFDPDVLRRAWESGVPGVLDLPDASPPPAADGGTSRSTFAVSLGSDGIRAWFLVLDAVTPRSALSRSVVESVLFLAGEAAAILLHRDLDEAGTPTESAERFSGWPVLRDVEGEEGDELTSRRISCRFLVTRTVRAALEEDLALDAEDLAHRVEAVRREMGARSSFGPEAERWEDVLRVLEAGDVQALPGAVLELGVEVEDQGHWAGAAELFRTARELAAAVGAAEAGVDAARFLGRVLRRRGRWDEAVDWYDFARRTASALGDRGREARALDGQAAVFIGQGNLPRARAVLSDAVSAAEASRDPDARGAVLHSLMTVAHTEGRLNEAARYGWRSVQAYASEGNRLQALTALGGVFLEGRELPAAETAFQIVRLRSRDQVYRLYALEGLAHVAAYRGDRAGFEAGMEEVHRAGFDTGPAEFVAEVMLERGDAYLHLGAEDAAREWYRKATAEAERRGLNEYLIRAEQALERLDRVSRGEHDEAPRTSPMLPEEELEAIRGGLGAIRSDATSGSLSG